MFKKILFAFALTFSFPLLANSKTIPKKMVIKVNGMVCAFCAQGVEKI